VNQEDSEHNEVDGIKKGVDSTSQVMHVKGRLVICNDTDGGARVTTRCGSVNRKTESISDIFKNRHRNRLRYFKNRKIPNTDQK